MLTATPPAFHPQYRARDGAHSFHQSISPCADLLSNFPNDVSHMGRTDLPATDIT